MFETINYNKKKFAELFDMTTIEIPENIINVFSKFTIITQGK